MWTAETVLVCALSLLTRAADSFPPVQFVAIAPAGVSATAEAFVLSGGDRIYVVTSTPTFRRAQGASDRCGDLQALRKVASVLVHEEWHVLHGADEAGAYAAQLTTLTYLNAGPGNPLYHEVSRAMRAVVARGKEPHCYRRERCSS